MIKKAFSLLFKQRFERWLKKRIPAQASHQLSRHNIFIMPTRFGFAYLLFVFILFLLATNYQNNIIMLMSYFLASFFISVMLHSFYNFSGMQLLSKPEHTGYASQYINLPITVVSDKTRFDVTVSLAKSGKHFSAAKLSCSQCEQGNTELILPILVNKRGVFPLGRIRIASEYSFGLFVSWSVLDFNHKIIVYPHAKQIKSAQFTLSGQESQAGHSLATTRGTDDFFELKSYVVGESLSRTAWKQFARGQGRYTKHYQNQQGDQCWLKLADMPSSSLEIKLSYLCYLIGEYSNAQQMFGLDLRSVTDGVDKESNQHFSHRNTNINTNTDIINKIEPSIGLAHQQVCLMALAHYHAQRNSG